MYLAFLLLSIFLNFEFLWSKPFQLQNYDIRYKNEHDNMGNYNFEYNTQFNRPEDDVGRSETGKLEKTSSGEDVLRVNGSYHYHVSCDHRIEVYYMADEKGFRARMVQQFNRKYERINGRLVLVAAWCAVVQVAPIGAACLASLQGACAGK